MWASALQPVRKTRNRNTNRIGIQIYGDSVLHYLPPPFAIPHSCKYSAVLAALFAPATSTLMALEVRIVRPKYTLLRTFCTPPSTILLHSLSMHPPSV